MKWQWPDPAVTGCDEARMWAEGVRDGLLMCGCGTPGRGQGEHLRIRVRHSFQGGQWVDHFLYGGAVVRSESFDGDKVTTE